QPILESLIGRDLFLDDLGVEAQELARADASVDQLVCRTAIRKHSTFWRILGHAGKQLSVVGQVEQTGELVSVEEVAKKREFTAEFVGPLRGVSESFVEPAGLI